MAPSVSDDPGAVPYSLEDELRLLAEESPLPFAETAPDTVTLMVLEGRSKALGADGAAVADRFRRVS